MQIQGKPQWDFCCAWYGVNEIEDCIKRDTAVRLEQRSVSAIPTDVRSHEFAEWLAHQYRLAMNKGIELAEQEMRGQLP